MRGQSERAVLLPAGAIVAAAVADDIFLVARAEALSH